ncbi:MAG: DUF2513 domain-containing protein [Paracoccaceae bacterium]|nr:DUF2513 domain-containing protein [Paracoccaceae bacterium]
MKRDNDFLRDLLFEIEAQDDFVFSHQSTLGEAAEERRRVYHIHLLCDAGFLTRTAGGGYRMTNQGHDYLDAIRSDTVWNRTKDAAAKIGGASLGMLMDLALAYLKQEASEKLGVRI